MGHEVLLMAALLLDAAIGEPEGLWRRVPHPVVLMGKTIEMVDRWLNRGEHRKLKGLLAISSLALAAALLGKALEQLPLSPLWEILIAMVLLAWRSLVDHVLAVADALGRSLMEARRAVGRIVGRETAEMDEPAVARAAMESAAENFSDGVIAPALWYLALGLPGILIYKLINTADSMIGYRNERYAHFGWAAARLDDAANWLPARLAALLIALAGGLSPQTWPRIAQEARRHRSPNAGWPEAAMAFALGTALSGPRRYHGELHDEPFVNPEGTKTPGAEDIRRAVSLLWNSWLLFLGLLLVIWLLHQIII